MPINRWWDKAKGEIYWLEITGRDDMGADLKAPQRDDEGSDYWSYSLVTEVDDGDVVVAARIGLAFFPGGLRDVDYLNLCCRSDTEPLAAARCALGLDPRMIAGCTTARVPALVAAEFAHARRLIERAATEPARSRRFVRRAKRVLAQMRDRGRRLAAKDDCGDSVALVASHALSTLGAQ